MAQSVTTPTAPDNHQFSSTVERRRQIRSTLGDLLTALPGSDERTRQVHKDIQSEKSRCAEHISLMVDSAISLRQESKVRAIANALLAFCSASCGRVQRAYSQIFCAETDVDGLLDNVELAVEQGDRSPRTLDLLIDLLTKSIAVQTEMLEWARRVRFGAR